MLYCNFKQLSVQAAQVVHYQVTDDGVPFDAQCLVFFEKVRFSLYFISSFSLNNISFLTLLPMLPLYIYMQNHVLNFHCSFQHKWLQRMEVKGRKRSAQCLDFVIPRQGVPLMFSVHYQEESSGDGLSRVDKVLQKFHLSYCT